MIEAAKRILNKRRNYRACFMDDIGKTPTVPGEAVLMDLARYCYGHKTTTMVSSNGTIDPIASAIAEGRRQVYLRILAMCQLPDSAILEALERE